MKQTADLPGEFELIARYFAPLARGFPGAFGLLDDAAVIAPAPGHELVAKTDAIVGGVHFLHDDPPDLSARKALRANLSDLAAKGAVPRAYMLDIMLPKTVTEEWMAAFARGLADDQNQYGVHLIGGDTDSTPGPVTIAIMAFGDIATGRRCTWVLATNGGHITTVLTGGDDYEILFTAPPEAVGELADLSRTFDVPITAIGQMRSPSIREQSQITVLDESLEPFVFDRSGWTQF